MFYISLITCGHRPTHRLFTGDIKVAKNTVFIAICEALLLKVQNVRVWVTTPHFYYKSVFLLTNYNQCEVKLNMSKTI